MSKQSTSRTRVTLAVILAAVLAAVTLATVVGPTMAAPNTKPAPAPVRLHQYTGSPIDYTAFVKDEKTNLTQPEIVNLSVPGFRAAFWHFVDPDKGNGKATVIFIDENGGKVIVENVGAYKNGQHFGVLTPIYWQLLDAWYTSPSPKLFNLSHTEEVITLKGY